MADDDTWGKFCAVTGLKHDQHFSEYSFCSSCKKKNPNQNAGLPFIRESTARPPPSTAATAAVNRGQANFSSLPNVAETQRQKGFRKAPSIMQCMYMLVLFDYN